MNAPAVQNPIRTVKDMLRSDAAMKQIATVAAAHLRPERLARTMANAVRVTPLLEQCDPMSLLGAMMTSAHMGLEPNTPAGHSYIIPFKNTKKQTVEAQLVIGYKGYFAMALRSGVVSYIDAGIHREDDDLWVYERGMNATLRHIDGPGQGKILHAYSIAKWRLPNGEDGASYVVLPIQKVMEVRDRSQGWKMALAAGKTKFNPWSTDEAAMVQKTAVRAHAQSGKLPMSTEIQLALSVDARSDVDFAAFAKDPSSGAPMRGDDNDDENASGEMIEGTAEAKDEAAKEPAQEKISTSNTTSGTKTSDGDAIPDHNPSKPARSLYDQLRDQQTVLLAELVEAGDRNHQAVLDGAKDLIENLRVNAPDLLTEVMEIASGANG